MEWADLVRAGIVGLFAFLGSLAAVKTDITWIKRAIARIDKTAERLAERLDRYIEKG